MRIGILAHSFSPAFTIYEALKSMPGQDVFITLSPSPHRSAWTSYLANIAKLLLTSLKNFTSVPVQLLVSGRLIFLHQPFESEHSLDTLRNLKLDVGLHKSGVIYRNNTIRSFRLGILNHHIGLLPAYRGRCVLEWAILEGEAVGITVFFIDDGIDTGSRILVSEQVDISTFRSISEAKQYLFSLDKVSFPKALTLLSNGKPAVKLNDGSGRRYYVMSELLTGVVQTLLRGKS